ncbi:MAG: class I SAM-dependent methyltransferase [Gemmataceae bacterium]
MDLASFAALLTPRGQLALSRAMALAPTESTFLTCFGKMAKQFDQVLARVALETALLRSRAAVKFRRAERMYFVRQALEQASSELVARHRAASLAQRLKTRPRLLDLGCGIGGDTLALAGFADVTAVDIDPLRLAMAEQNVRVYEVSAHFHHGDGLSMDTSFEVLYTDPDRRVGGRRQLSLEACLPALSAVRERFARQAIVAKLAPGVPEQEVRLLGGEAEYVSLDGELKECVWWSPPLATARVRATILPHEQTLTSDDPLSPPPPNSPGDWLIDPCPAVVRAGLVGELAARLNAWPLEPGIAYLSANEWTPTPWARAWRIRAAMPFHLARLRDYLRLQGIGPINLMRRGVPYDLEELSRKLKRSGSEAAQVVLCPHQGKPWAIVCHLATAPADL